MCKEEFVTKIVDELENGFSIQNNDGNIQLMTNSDDGKPIVIAEVTKNGEYRRYYTKSKVKK